jgi:hypothetical protein
MGAAWIFRYFSTALTVENGVFLRLCRSSFAVVRDCADFSVSRTGVKQGAFKGTPPIPIGSDQKQPGRP